MGKLLNKLASNIRGHKEWLSDYMTEMSILVISLAATFYGESLISNYADEQDDKTIMLLVIDEMRTNIKELADMEQYYSKNISYSLAFSKYLYSEEKPSTDSLDILFSHCQISFIPFLKKNALNLMNNSGTIKRIENKQLLMQIFDCYNSTEIVLKINSDFIQEQNTQISDFVLNLGESSTTATTIEQWNLIAENKAFKQYLLTSYLRQSNINGAICKNTREMHEETAEELVQIYKNEE